MPIVRYAIATLGLSAGLFLPVMAAQTSFAANPGLWEISIATQETATPTPEALKQIPAEQMARFKAGIAALAKNQQPTRTYKRCISQREFDAGINPTNSDERDCKRTMVSRTPFSMDIREQCTGNGHRTGTVHVQAVNPQVMLITANMKMADEMKMADSTSTVRARWLGPDCGHAN